MRYLFLLALFFVCSAHAEQVMTLDNFISQMKLNNSGYKSSAQSKIASQQETYTSRLLTSPQFYVNADTGEDKSPTMVPESNGTLKTKSEIETGIQTQTEFGLMGKIFVGESVTKISGASPAFLPPDQTQLIMQNYGVELQLPLLKNGFGKDIQLKKEAILRASEASQAYSQFEQMQLENKAILTYVKVTKLQETIELQKTSLGQGKSLVNWAQARVSTKILEDSDLLQAVASMQARDFNLQTSLLALGEAQKEFNSLIGANPSQPLPKLQSLEELVPNTSLVQVPVVRSDLKALTKSIESERSRLLLQQEDYKPEFNIIGKAITYSKQSELNDSARCTSFQACSQSFIGISLKLPLNFEATSNALSSTESKIKAKELSLEDSKNQSLAEAQKLFETSKILKMQRELSEKIIATQKLRVEEEHKRQKFGRASAFDIIRAEQDYVESQINALSIIYSQAEINTNFKLFEVEK